LIEKEAAMRFSAEDRQFIRTLAQQHAVSESAIEALFVALQAGNGTAAQFNHPDLGGMGQWMASGMIMIGDFSNYRLKATVAQLCTEIVDYLRAQPQTAQRPAFAPFSDLQFSATAEWWPPEFGTPTASGAQDAMQYAYFAQAKRLALRIQDRVAIYDTKDHQIQGISQQQDRKQTVVFRSQKGMIALDKLTKLREYKV
jgi:hypothetical protein